MSGVTEAGNVITTSLESLSSPVADQHAVAEFEQALAPMANAQGGGLLHELGQIKEQFTDAKRSVQASLATSGDDPAKLMQLQWSLMRINLQEELIAKTVGRTTQNIETLMKAQ